MNLLLLVFFLTPGSLAESPLPTDLTLTLKNLSAGDVIFLNGIYRMCDLEVNTSNVSLISRSGATIECHKRNRNIAVYGSNVLIDGINFVNGTAIEGGCILISGSNVTVRNGRIENCTASGNGGGIAFLPTSKNCSLENVHVRYCSAAESGGGIFISASNVRMKACSLSENTCRSNGAGIHLNHSRIIFEEFVEMRTNTAQKGSGGALYAINSGVEICSDAYFNSNMANMNGGAIFLQNCSMLMSHRLSVIECESTGYGGGVFLCSKSVLRVLGFATWISNTGLCGGAVYSRDDSEIFLRNSSFYGNLARGGDGGGIFLHGSSLTVELASFFLNNTALNAEKFARGGAITCSGGQVTLLGNFSFHNNFADVGGAIYVLGGQLNLVDSHAEAEFVGNVASSDGGAVYLDTQSIGFLVGILFLNNNATSGNGGALVGQATVAVVLDRVRMERNSAAVDGGAINVQDGGELSLSNCLFSRNSAQEFGGAVALYSSSLIANASSFSANYARWQGGAIFSRYSDIRAGTCQFHGNLAGDAGGALGLAGSVTATFYDAFFQSNSALNRAPQHCVPSNPCGGGAILVTDDVTLMLSGQSMLLNNSALQKGGIVLNSGLQSNGGAILVASAAAVKVAAGLSRLWGNSAGVNGGGVALLDLANLELLQGVTVQWNTAGGQGGGVFSDGPGANITLHSATVAHNRAGADGGGLAIYGPAVAYGNCVIASNLAGGTGGGIFASGCDAVVTVGAGGSVNVVNNAAATHGGGIALDSAAGLVLESAAEPCACPVGNRGNGQCDMDWCANAAPVDAYV